MISIDTYSLHARVMPVVVVCLPPLALLGAGIITTSALGVGSGVIATVCAAITSQLGRDRGRALQPELWATWGGSPTLTALRHRGARAPRRVARTHQCIEIVLGLDLPTAAEEAADPLDADAQYDEAIERLIARTRDKEKFDLLRAENQNYGQRRNLLGLKRIGVIVAGLTLLLAIALCIATTGAADQRLARYAPGAVVAAGTLWFWTRVVTEAWVRIPADAYARQLLQATEILATEHTVRG